MAKYLRIDMNEDKEEVTWHYDNEIDLIESTNEFYHETYRDEEGYNPQRMFKSIEECAELWEGNDYIIAKII